MIEELGYDNLVVSIKSSDVMMCVKAHELLARGLPVSPPCGDHRVRDPAFWKYQILCGPGDHPATRALGTPSVFP